MSLLDFLIEDIPPKRSASMLERLGFSDRAIDPRDMLFEGARFGRKPVGESEDLARILALPRRERPSREEQEAMAVEMTERLRVANPSCRCAELRPWAEEPCITRLLPVQGWYLTEASSGEGAVGHIIVGGGKTGIDILLAMVLPSVRRAALLIPPNLRAQFATDFELWSQHFKVPNLAGGRGPFVPGRPTLTVLAYSELSRESCATWLKANSPDLIICDEAQNLKDKNSVRTGRFLRYFMEADGVRLCVHSGSLTTRSLDDYAHLSALALREESPLPLETATVHEWCGVLDPSTGGPPAPMGSLRKLCEIGESPRSGFRRRLTETRGIITTEDAELSVRLTIRKRDPGHLPPKIQDALNLTRARQTRPDGEELVEALEVATVARQLAAGFFYRWKYPRGEPEELILRWFSRRQAWNRELRERLERRSDLLDSPKLLRAAAERYLAGYRGELPVWRSESFAPWLEIETQVQPVRDTVWIDDFLARDAVRWAQEAPGIVWYGHSAWGHKVAELSGLPLFGGGEEASREIAKENGKRSIIASIKAHGTGKNLQMFSRMLVGNPPADGGVWEQLLGRLHRHGQRADQVDVFVYRHTVEMREALDRALGFARYVQQTTGKAEKLLFSERRFDSETVTG